GFSDLIAQIHRLKARIALDDLLLKNMRSSPPNSFPAMEIRQAALGLDFDRSHLRVLEHTARKFDPDQPRISAGNPGGGQWTTGTGGLGSGGAEPMLGRPAIKPMRGPKPGTPFGQGTGSAIAGQALRQLLESDPFNSSFKGTAYEAVDRYNWLLQRAPASIVPALHFTPHEFQARQGLKLETVVVPLLREQVEDACPLFGAVKTEANLAAQAAGKVSDYRSPSEYGTRVHTLMKERITHHYDGRLIPERSYLKYDEENLNDAAYRQAGIGYGRLGSLRLDVLEDVGNDVICVYDVKTGRSGLTTARMREIGKSVYKNFGEKYRILIIPIKPESIH
ncbi:MAG: hypothetical protein ACRECY_19095, partial [Phyllobacterium sp.]